MLKLYCLLFTIGAVLMLTPIPTAAQADKDARSVASSALLGVRLPAGALRINDESVPAEITETLGNLVALGQGKLRQGESEALIWTGAGYRKSNAPQFIKKLAENLQNGGWTYAVGEQNGNFTAFSSLNTGARRAVIGFWTANDEALLLAWTEMLPADAADATSPNVGQTSANKTSAPPVTKNARNVLRVGAETNYVNAMGDEMPAFPQFSALPKKAGFVRGYVKDTRGRAVVGARLGLKTARMYDAYLANSAETDAKGYYEIKIPMGGARFDYAGVTIEYGAGRAALGLHPSDGRLDESYPAATGGVENFVLLPFGIADRDGVSRQANYRANYYGGSMLVRYFIGGFSKMLSPGDEIEITLTPDGDLIDGSAGKSFVIRKTVEDSSLGEFMINNVPVGRYRIEVKQANGKPLRLKQKTPTDSVFGIQPAEANGSASLVFNPLSADAKTATASRGNWTDLEIIVERP